MIAPIEINRVTVKGGAGMPTSEYAQLVYKGEEIGFISEQGIFLKMWHPELKSGVFQNINTFNDKSFTQKCKLVEKNWDAINDSGQTGMHNINIYLKSGGSTKDTGNIRVRITSGS